jgi:hypothetical protein
MVTGKELADGLPLNLNTGETLKIIITTLK